MLSLDFDQVMERLKACDLLEPLRAAFVAPPAAPDRGHYAIERGAGADGVLLVMPAWRPGGHIGVKLATVFPDNAGRGLPSVMAQYLLMSAETGEPVALIDGRALTLKRTAAVSALAAGLLTPRDVRRLLVVGAGALAPELAEAHAAVRDYQHIDVWARDPAKSDALAARLRNAGLQANAAMDLEAAARAADVISCATLATEPLVRGAWLKAEAHLDLVGGFRPDMREADDDAMRGALVVTDTLRALEEAGDLSSPVATGALRAEDVFALTALLQQGWTRPAGAGRTVFKSVGTALADLAAAEVLVRNLSPA